SRLSSNFQACAPGRFIPTRKSALLTDMIFPSRTQIRRQTLSLFVLLSNEATNDSGRSEKRRRRSSSLQYAGSRINSSASEAGTSTTPVPPGSKLSPSALICWTTSAEHFPHLSFMDLDRKRVAPIALRDATATIAIKHPQIASLLASFIAVSVRPRRGPRH